MNFTFLMMRLFLVLSSLSLLQGKTMAQTTNNSATENQLAKRAPLTSKEALTLNKGMNQLSVWGGISFDSPAGNFLGLVEDRQFFIVGLRYGRIVAAGRGIALAYVFDVIPIAVVSNNPKIVNGHRIVRDDRTVDFHQALIREPVYGAGLSPIGLQIYFFREKRVKLFANGSTGFLTFFREVPLPDARKFNYTFEFGGGVQVVTWSRWTVSLGYKFHHLSNANTAAANPGLDANIFYMGLSIFN
jgi:hypothetical protein